MRWWLTTHRIGPLIVAVILSTAAATLFGDIPIAFPSLAGGGGMVALALAAILPLVTGMALAHSQASGDRPSARVSVRPQWWAGLAVPLACLAVAGVIGLVLSPLDGLPVVALRDVTGVIGIQLLLTRLLAPARRPLVPVVFVFGCALFGRRPGGLPVWAWPLAEAGSVSAALIAAGLLVAGGLVALPFCGRRRW